MSVMGAAPLSQSGLDVWFSARRRRISASSAWRFCFSRAVASRREEVEGVVRKERSLFAILCFGALKIERDVALLQLLFGCMYLCIDERK